MGADGPALYEATGEATAAEPVEDVAACGADGGEGMGGVL